MKDKKELCGIFGAFGVPDAGHVTCVGLYALQHRGEESAGIVTSDGQNLSSKLGMGLVGQGVHGLGPVQRNHGNVAVLHGVDDFFVRHRLVTPLAVLPGRLAMSGPGLSSPGHGGLACPNNSIFACGLSMCAAARCAAG